MSDLDKRSLPPSFHYAETCRLNFLEAFTSRAAVEVRPEIVAFAPDTFDGVAFRCLTRKAYAEYHAVVRPDRVEFQAAVDRARAEYESASFLARCEHWDRCAEAIAPFHASSSDITLGQYVERHVRPLSAKHHAARVRLRVAFDAAILTAGARLHHACLRALTEAYVEQEAGR